MISAKPTEMANAKPYKNRLVSAIESGITSLGRLALRRMFPLETRHAMDLEVASLNR